MPNIKTISDGGRPNPLPTIEQMRESQRAGSVGTGTDDSYADKMAVINHGTGKGTGKDEQFPDEAAEYSDGSDVKLPWEQA